MAAITEQTEQAVAESRGRLRQNKQVPWLIRDDGIIFPNVPGIAKKKNFRPYRGKLDATLEERLNYLKGLPVNRQKFTLSEPLDEEPPVFDLKRATRDECVQIALEQFGVTLDPSKHVNTLRAEVARLAGVLPPKEGSGGSGTPPGAEA